MKLIFRYPDTGEIHEHDTKGTSVEAIFRREARFFAGSLNLPDNLIATFQLASVEEADAR